jgi:hypothetical protein
MAVLEIGATVAVPIVSAAPVSAIARNVFMSTLLLISMTRTIFGRPRESKEP